MQAQISKSKFKAQALEIMRGVEQTGDEVIITSHGKPTLLVTRYPQTDISPLEQLKGSVLKFDNPSAPVAEDDCELG